MSGQSTVGIVYGNVSGPKASAMLVNAFTNIYGAAAMKSAAKMLRKMQLQVLSP